MELRMAVLAFLCRGVPVSVNTDCAAGAEVEAVLHWEGTASHRANTTVELGAATVTWEGRSPMKHLHWDTVKAVPGGLGRGRSISPSMSPVLYSAARSDLCSSRPVIHSFSHQLKIPVV